MNLPRKSYSWSQNVEWCASIAVKTVHSGSTMQQNANSVDARELTDVWGMKIVDWWNSVNSQMQQTLPITSR